MKPDEARQKMITYSKQFVGVPYLYGGTTRSGMDCSGFIFTVANDAIGTKLPRSTSALYASVRIIKDSEREPGDLLFFKTVGSRISHVGLYLGNNQFIHAASDGPNTGVIISSLKESYWSRTYSGAGRFLPATGGGEKRVNFDTSSGGNEASGSDLISSSSEQSSFSETDSTSGVRAGTLGSFWSKWKIDGSLTGDWTFFTANRFHFVFRGVTLDAHARYSGGQLEPGLGFSLAYDPSIKAFQIPLLFSLTVLKGIRVYAGPVFTMGNPIEPDRESSKIKGSIFPGVLGLSLQTPTLKAGKVELSLIQDIRYTVFNNSSGAALPFVSSIATGLKFSTGVRVTFPMSNFI